jgi:hypothetical protein
MKHQAALALAVPLVLALCAAARAVDAQGPAFGNNAYSAAIAAVDGAPDSDAYVSSLVVGEKLDVVVAAAKGEALLPALTLVAPDGAEIVPSALAAQRGGHTLSLHAFPVTQTGRWTVRVSGGQGTQGAYSVSFSIKSARATTARRASIEAPTETLTSFEALDGSLVDVTVTPRNAKAPVKIRGVTDPQGRPVSGPAVAGRGQVLRRLSLHGGDGTYVLRLGTEAPKALYDLTIKVTPQGRPTTRRSVALSPFDPSLAPLDAPLLGVPGMTVRIDGSGFDPASPPSVLFGTAPAAATPAADGRSLNVIVPDGLAGATVAVTVIGRDGQRAVRDAYFHYVEPPAVSDLIDLSGRSVRALDVAGGRELLLRGEFFAAGQQVYFGTEQAVVNGVPGSTSMSVVVPASVAGPVQICVVDAYGRTCRWTGEVEYMATPTISSVTALDGPFQIDASDVAAAGGATIEIDGTDFHADDFVTVAGAAATVVSQTAQTITIVAPPGPVGPAQIIVTNAAGLRAAISGALFYQ